MLVEKIFGDSGVRGMKWYAVGESSWEKMSGKWGFGVWGGVYVRCIHLNRQGII